MNKDFIKKILGGTFQMILIFIVVFGALVTFEYFQQKQDRKNQMAQVSLYRDGGEEIGLIRVLGETSETKQEHQGNRFVARDVTLGGETLMAMTADDKVSQVEISHLQGKLYRSNEDDDINYYTSWQSNKPTLSIIKYQRDDEESSQVIEEENYGYVHAITLPSVNFSSVYKYVISSKDRWGNEVEAGPFVFYTGAPEASFFTLLEESFGDVFGWMTK
jgi:hypothetical protein